MNIILWYILYCVALCYRDDKKAIKTTTTKHMWNFQTHKLWLRKETIICQHGFGFPNWWGKRISILLYIGLLIFSTSDMFESHKKVLDRVQSFLKIIFRSKKVYLILVWRWMNGNKRNFSTKQNAMTVTDYEMVYNFSCVSFQLNKSWITLPYNIPWLHSNFHKIWTIKNRNLRKNLKTPVSIISPLNLPQIFFLSLVEV